MTLQRIAEQITQRWVARRDPDTPVNLTILNRPSQFIGALTQCKKKKGEKNPYFRMAVHEATTAKDDTTTTRKLGGTN